MWRTVKLGDVCELAYGKALAKSERLEFGEIPAFGANGIKTYAKNALFSEPSIIVGRKGSAGQITKVTQPFWPLDVTYYAKTDANRIDLDFLYYTLSILDLPSMARGVKPGINRNDLYGIDIFLPPLAEQKRIVERLDKAFAEIDKAIATAEAKEGEIKSLSSSLLTSVLKSYLGQSETIALQNVCDFFGDGDWIETKDQAPEGLRLIQTGNIKVGSFADRKKNARYIDEETFKRLRCTEIFAGDLLVSRLPDPVGRACLIPELGERAITAVDCTIIRPKRDFVDANYLNYYLQSNQYFENVQKVVTGATRQRISRKNLGQVPIIVPPLETQREIVRRLNRVSEKVKTLNGANSQSQAAYLKLKAAILKQELTPGEAV